MSVILLRYGIARSRTRSFTSRISNLILNYLGDQTDLITIYKTAPHFVQVKPPVDTEMDASQKPEKSGEGGGRDCSGRPRSNQLNEICHLESADKRRLARAKRGERSKVSNGTNARGGEGEAHRVESGVPAPLPVLFVHSPLSGAYKTYDVGMWERGGHTIPATPIVRTKIVRSTGNAKIGGRGGVNAPLIHRPCSIDAQSLRWRGERQRGYGGIPSHSLTPHLRPHFCAKGRR
jgi:hypothetical protein